MKLTFSTAYDEAVFKNKQELDVKYVGPLSLLNILERELGLYDIYKPEKDRIKQYLDCLSDNKENTFYENSLIANDLNVAKQVLSYRDELILLGWKHTVENQPIRFKDLSTVENSFVTKNEFKGVADRWQIVLESLSVDKIKEFNIDTLIVMDAKNDLPIHLKLVFEKMSSVATFINDPSIIEEPLFNLDKFKNQLINIVYNLNQPEKLSNTFKKLEEDQSLQIVNFKNEQLLMDCMASMATNDCLFINRENTNFDFSLVSFGKPASGSKQVQANPQITQIVKLITPCFSKDLNIQTLLSFLTLAYNPLDFNLAKKLAKLLTEMPGVANVEWNTILNCYVGANLENVDLTEKELQLLEYFETRTTSEIALKERKKSVNLLLEFNTPPEKSVKKGQKILKYLKEWATDKTKSQIVPELREQFNDVADLCQNVLDNFDFENEKAEKLEEMIMSFYEAQNYTNYYKQQNSVEVLKDINAIAQPTNKNVFWLDFNAENSSKAKPFLLEEEKQFLQQYNCYYSPELAFNLQLKQWLKGLLNCKQQLLLCVINDGQKEKHPLHIRLEGIFGKSSQSIYTEISTIDEFVKVFNIAEVDKLTAKNIPLPLPKDYFVSNTLKEIEKRKVESASSIEKFIEYPFDWVMQYMAKFSNDVGFKIPDDNLLKGNVAHKTIELTISKYPELNFTDDDLEAIFLSVLERQAANFLQPEKRFELSEFKYRFYKSFNNLVDIIKINEFKIEALEYAFGKEENCVIDELLGNASGYIDMYLKDKQGNPFIIDLKWGYSDKKYIKKMEQNEAVQLAIYTAAIKQRELANTAYFMLNQNNFITAADNIKGNNIFRIEAVVNNQEVLNKIKTSIEFRWSEIKQGKLEIGDDCSLGDLEYYTENGVIGIPEDKKVKKAYPYTGYKLFKGALK